MILDLIIFGIILLLVIIGAARGIAKTLLNLLSVAAAGIFSYLAAGLLSNLIYTAFIGPSITNSVTDSMADSTAAAGAVVQDAIDGLPEFMVNIFSFFGITTDALSKSADTALNTAGTSAAQAVEIAVKPAVTGVLSIILIVLLFIIFLIICKKISKKLERLFHIPIVGTLNRILGGALGFLEGSAVCLIVIFVLKISMAVSGDPIISSELIDGSYVFAAVYNSEVLNGIAEVIGIGKGAAGSVSDMLSEGASEIVSAVE